MQQFVALPLINMLKLYAQNKLIPVGYALDDTIFASQQHDYFGIVYFGVRTQKRDFVGEH